MLLSDCKLVGILCMLSVDDFDVLFQGRMIHGKWRPESPNSPTDLIMQFRVQTWLLSFHARKDADGSNVWVTWVVATLQHLAILRLVSELSVFLNYAVVSISQYSCRLPTGRCWEGVKQTRVIVRFSQHLPDTRNPSKPGVTSVVLFYVNYVVEYVLNTPNCVFWCCSTSSFSRRGSVGACIHR